MKKFKFPLQSVLKVRSLHKKVAERELAVTLSRVNHNRDLLERNEEEYAETFRMLHQPSGNPAFWSDLSLRYQESLRLKKVQLEEERTKLAEKLEGEKKTLTRKMRDEMVIEKLRDHQKAEHKVLAEAEIQREIEEIDILKRGNPQ